MPKKHIIKKSEYAKKKISELAKPGTELVRPHTRRITPALAKARKENLAPPFTKKTAKKGSQILLDLKSKELKIAASSSSLDGIANIIKKQWYWSKVEFQPAGKNIWEVFNAKGKSSYIVKLDKKRYKLYSIN